MQPGAAMTVKEIEGRCWFARIGLLLFSDKMSSEKFKLDRLAWIGMLLLPIGIALRFVKTSLELGIPLQ